MARPTPGRLQFHYLESWLLPSLGLRANIFHFSPGYERDQDFYLDVGEFSKGPTVWQAEDHYIDLVVHTGDRTDVIDVPELLQAHREGLVSIETADHAIARTLAVVEGLARHDHDLQSWLTSIGMDLTWRKR